MYSRRIALHCTTALDCMVLSDMTPQLWVNVRPVRTRWVSHLSVGTLTFGPWSEFILGGKARLGWDGMDGWMVVLAWLRWFFPCLHSICLCSVVYGVEASVINSLSPPHRIVLLALNAEVSVHTCILRMSVKTSSGVRGGVTGGPGSRWVGGMDAG